MALTHSRPPAKALDIVRTALGSLIDQPTGTAHDMALGGTENLRAAAPHKIYFVGLQDVAGGRLLSSAKLTGWRYIIVKGDYPMAAAELGTDESGGGLEFSQLNQGPFVSSTVEGVSLAERLDEVLSDNYEPRLLRIPGLFVIALWLHGQTQNDLLIPLPPTRPELEPYATYTEEDFLKAIQQAAIKKNKRIFESFINLYGA